MGGVGGGIREDSPYPDYLAVRMLQLIPVTYVIADDSLR
jgi:hypothetical protein